MCLLSLSAQVECSGGEENDFLGQKKFILWVVLERNLFRGLKSCFTSSIPQEDAGCGREVIRN